MKKAASDAEIAEAVNAAEISLGNWGYDKVAELLALTNDPDYNLLKLSEETAELQEVLLKTFTKAEDRKPSDEKLVEELGDVIFRAMIFVTMRGEDFAKSLDERMHHKASKLLGYYKDGKYKGGI